MIRLGIDLGGTKIEIVVLGPGNEALLRKRTPTGQEKGYDEILSRIEVLYREAVDYIGNQPHTLGMGIPGAISAKSDRIKNANTVCLNGKSLKQDLEQRLEHPIEIQNDANCFTFAETLMGAGIGKELVFGVIMGTGCGGGLAIRGKVHTGIQRIAGEWGHMQIDPAGPPCYCGKRGCVETYISGGGIQNIYRERYGARKTVEEIVAGYRAGEPQTTEVFGDFLHRFGIAMANVIDLLDPDMVVLGGGLSNIDELYTLGRIEVAREVFSDGLETPIVKNRLGDSAGVFGAALIGI